MTTSLSFPLAPMSAGIRWLTSVLLLVPAAMGLASMALPRRSLAVPALLLAVLYFIVWFVARPTRFEISGQGLMVFFPAWRRTIPAGGGLRARLLGFKEFRQEFGTPLRIGVGGLWGGFGWLWTSRRGLVEFYISRTDGFVLVERDGGRPLLITPERPESMIQAIAATWPPADSRW